MGNNYRLIIPVTPSYMGSAIDRGYHSHVTGSIE